jgi:DNA-3-methyladenine glycosylase I
MTTKNRCAWAGQDPIYQQYHDNEWGKAVHDDQVLFEFLILEGFQAGLSWITILKKRDNFRLAFDDFDYRKIATYDIAKKEELLLNTGIVRNRLKIDSSIINAKAFMAVQQEFGSFDAYIWAFVDHQPIYNHFDSMAQMPAKTPLSDQISKDLKKRGFKFIGSTIIYAFMQAIGMVNDHTRDCYLHEAY